MSVWLSVCACACVFLSEDVLYVSCWAFVLWSHPPGEAVSLSYFLYCVLLTLLFNPPRPWRRTGSGWHTTSRERPMLGQSWPECHGWSSIWTKPIKPSHSSTMMTIQMVRHSGSGQWAHNTGASANKGQQTVTTWFTRNRNPFGVSTTYSISVKLPSPFDIVYIMSAVDIEHCLLNLMQQFSTGLNLKVHICP